MSNGKPFKNFDDFHSNLGEIRIVQHTQVSEQAHSSKSSSPRNALPPVGFSSAKEDEEPILTPSAQKENTTLPVLALTDEEIDDLLFGEFNDLEAEETEIMHRVAVDRCQRDFFVIAEHGFGDHGSRGHDVPVGQDQSAFRIDDKPGRLARCVPRQDPAPALRRPRDPQDPAGRRAGGSIRARPSG